MSESTNNDTVYNLLKERGLSIRNSGADYVIHCLNPEHEDKNPSLRIDKESGVYNCVSCGFKGNIFKYFGILVNPNSLKITKLKSKLLDVKNALYSFPPPKGALPWIREFRGISPETLKHFGAIHTRLVPDLVDRICFPMKDITGKVVAFVCRHTLSNASPKYFNYPRGVTMPLYPPIVKGYKSIVLVEGIFDVINLWDKGMYNAVAIMGVNTLDKDTEEKLLPFKAQGITKIYLMLDNDDAGNKANYHYKKLLTNMGYVVEIISLQPGTDPGDLSYEDVKSIVEYISKT